MKLTHQLIEAGKSQAGGWNKKQIECLGMRWKDLKEGWKRRLVGTEIPDSQYALFLKHRKPDKPFVPIPDQFDFMSDLLDVPAEIETDPETPPW